MTGDGAGRLRVLVVHNAYQQRGGEDSVVEAECALLRQRGHPVDLYARSNDEIDRRMAAHVALETLWSQRAVADVKARIAAFKPDIIHVHNTFPLVSPGVYWAGRSFSVPVVQTLHNFRLLCPQAMLLRGGRVCEACIGKVPWRAVVYRCYRGSALPSAVSCATLTVHRALGTYRHKVSRYIALTEFARRKFIEGGLPASKIVVKPNFVDVAAPGPASRTGALYVGRLSEEKGIAVIRAAMDLDPELRLRCVGEGPARAQLADAPRVILEGFLDAEGVYERMRRAAFLLLPSLWYEGFPRVLVEAFACGLPVIAAKLGSLAQLIRHRETGLLVAAGSAAELKDAMRWAEDNAGEMAVMGANARAEYERRYTAQANYGRLMEIYAEAIESNGPESHGRF